MGVTKASASSAKIILLIVILPESFSFFLVVLVCVILPENRYPLFGIKRQNHKASRDCPPTGAFAPAPRAHIAAPDRPDRLHPPHGWRWDAENQCPIAAASVTPRPKRARSAPPRRKAAWKCARRRTL